MDFLKLFTILVLFGLALSVPLEKKSGNGPDIKKGDYNSSEDFDFSGMTDNELDAYPFPPCSEDWVYEFKNNHKYDVAYEYWRRYNDYYRRHHNRRHHYDDDKNLNK